MTISKNHRRLATALTTGAMLIGSLGAAHAGMTDRAPQDESSVSAKSPGWHGITRKQVSIDFGKGWVTKAELTYPTGSRGRLPLVVMLHGSGHNDMNQTLPEGKGATFVPLAQAASRQGFATLRFNKRGVTDIGPVETKDEDQLNPDRPYEQIQEDAASAIRFGATSSRVDASRIFLLGHSEGTNVAANLAADPKTYGIPKPAGVIAMGVVGQDIRELLTLQLYGRLLLQMHDEFDVDGDGQLTAVEAVDGLIGQPKELADQIRPVLLDGDKVRVSTDVDGDGRIAIDAEAGAVLRESTKIDDYPEVPGLEDLQEYVADIARFPTVTEALPRFDEPTLLLNGENDLQTPARVALTADAAVGAAGNDDHEVIIYPGMAHTMNITPRFVPELGDPDQQVLRDVGRWLRSHR
ncbi:alpha/beta fold hydrolase [Aeromicrobium sp. NPDC092404]|uniref:alpha/beta hydrolase family protein n=1 Tax=Aeromicrobium sp. NPDC092404 TaxID=3154976 RepID=UPI00341345F3